MTATIRIKLHEIGEVEIPATIVGELAIHRPTRDGEAFDATQWRITHVPSGLCIDSITPAAARKSKPVATRFAKELQARAAEDWARVAKVVRFGSITPPKAAHPALRRIRDVAREIAFSI
jgi:SpoVK/Ycf46/Vps4 family AAA+-type ATPase